MSALFLSPKYRAPSGWVGTSIPRSGVFTERNTKSLAFDGVTSLLIKQFQIFIKRKQTVPLKPGNFLQNTGFLKFFHKKLCRRTGDS